MNRSRALYRFALLTAVATFCLLLAGGVVTSTDSGLAVPDWPLSYGTWFPPMVGGIRYEHSHRMLAGVVGLMILALAIWTGRVEPRRWVRRLGYAALGAVVLQALLGGLTVLLLLPPQISIAHACLGQTVFCLVICLAHATAPGRCDQPTPLTDRAAPLRASLSLLAAILAAGQLVLGAVIRHTGHAVAWHIGGALALMGTTGWLLWRLRELRRAVPTLWRAGWRLAGVMSVQAGLGAAVFLHRGSLLLRTAHVGCGALVLAQAVVLAWELLRRGAAPVPAPGEPVLGAGS